MEGAHQREERQEAEEAAKGLAHSLVPHAWPIGVQHGSGSQHNKRHHHQNHDLRGTYMTLMYVAPTCRNAHSQGQEQQLA